MANKPKCPECGSRDNTKHGFGKRINGRKIQKVQKYLCKGCLRVFTEHKKK